ncbi:DUF485 domain-containing protein [Sphingomonas yunnanensis]|uniref:DUF485 domain-containing protein n=1 Tax=Sphingomonas yunnanensis TaxID=310400 RepID=UPI001CA6B857|nr:DUF485 domain-containing protein [Sphingomonas yunnanensis]MBY9062050.1 DUF485 domain-containing protein [Sphingomonas yunnanensis]
MDQRDAALELLAEHPRYRRLVRRRGRLALSLTALMLVGYLGYVLLVAFDKPLLARSLAGGATSWGIPIGLGVILLAIALTGIYVYRANREFDAEVAAIVAEARR